MVATSLPRSSAAEANHGGIASENPEQDQNPKDEDGRHDADSDLEYATDELFMLVVAVDVHIWTFPSAFPASRHLSSRERGF